LRPEKLFIFALEADTVLVGTGTGTKVRVGAKIDTVGESVVVLRDDVDVEVEVDEFVSVVPDA
jgi:hypothetical protein